MLTINVPSWIPGCPDKTFTCSIAVTTSCAHLQLIILSPVYLQFTFYLNLSFWISWLEGHYVPPKIDCDWLINITWLKWQDRFISSHNGASEWILCCKWRPEIYNTMLTEQVNNHVIYNHDVTMVTEHVNNHVIYNHKLPCQEDKYIPSLW